MRARGALAGIVVAFALTAVGGAEDARVDDLLAVRARGGTQLRREPAPLAPAVRTLAYGERVWVREVRGAFLRVRTLKDEGWVRTFDVAEPRTLFPSGGADGVAPSRRDATERAYRAENPHLGAAYSDVDAIERTKPTDEEVRAFIREGRLGR
jgi:hypothetical protein